MQLSIIIVSYNVKYYLEQTLRSVFASKEGCEAEIFVVDNASSDGSIEYLRKKFPTKLYPHLYFIESATNLGFGKANNLALQRSTGDYILFLNPDTILTEHTLSDCLVFAHQHDDMGGLGVCMLQTNGCYACESRRGLPTPWVAFCKMSGLSSLFPHTHLFGHYYMSHQPDNINQSIEIISGAFMMLSRKGVEYTNGFDERFFMYGEDIDLSYRLLRAGLKNYYVHTPILHYKGESTHKNSFRYVHVFYEAMLIFFRKHYPYMSRILYIPVMLAIVMRALLTLCFQQYNTFRHFLFPFRENKPENLCYVGNNFDLLQTAATTWNLTITTTDNPTIIPKNTKIIAFDATQYSYNEILNYLASSKHTYHIGIFYPNKKMLITGCKVYVQI